MKIQVVETKSLVDLHFNIEQLKKITLQLSDFLSQFNYTIIPYNERGLQRFETLTAEKQSQIIQNFQVFLQLCERAAAADIDLEKENHKLLWWALKELGFVPHSDLLEQITPDMTVEIYNLESIQIFRTLNLLPFLTYSFVELASFEWWELFSRNSAIETEMHHWASQVISGNIDSAYFKTNLPAHEVFEVLHEPKKLAGIMKHRLFSPLKDRNGNITGALSAFHVCHDWKNIK